MTVILKGKELAEKIRNNIADEISNLAVKPSITVIIVGEDPASRVYVKKKKEAAIQAGMTSEIKELKVSTTQEELEKLIDSINNNPDINAVIVQLPLPKHINSADIIQKYLP